jgi:hypothetical protein
MSFSFRLPSGNNRVLFEKVNLSPPTDRFTANCLRLPGASGMADRRMLHRNGEEIPMTTRADKYRAIARQDDAFLD